MFFLSFKTRKIPFIPMWGNIGCNVKGLPKENIPEAEDVMFIINEAGDESPPAKTETFLP